MNEKTSNFGNADVSIIGGFLLNRVSQFLKKSWFFPLFVYDICRTGEKTIIVFDWLNGYRSMAVFQKYFFWKLGHFCFMNSMLLLLLRKNTMAINY